MRGYERVPGPGADDCRRLREPNDQGWARVTLGLALLAAALLAASPARPAEPYAVRTLTLDATETAKGPVKLLWEGEISNHSVGPATLCAVLAVLDAQGRVLTELRSATVNVDRFASVRRTEVFEVAPDLWRKADVVEERAALSGAKPVNGERVRDVELYTTSWCPWCKKAKEYLTARGIAFVEHDVEREPGAAKARAQAAPGKGVPVLVVDGEAVVGYSEAAFDKLLRGGAEAK